MGRRATEGGRGHGGELGVYSNYRRNHLECEKRVLGSVSHSPIHGVRGSVWLLQRMAAYSPRAPGDEFCGRQFSVMGRGWFGGMIHVHYMYWALYFWYDISSTSDHRALDLEVGDP